MTSLATAWRKIGTAPSPAIMRLQGSARCRVQKALLVSDCALLASPHYLKNLSANEYGPIQMVYGEHAVSGSLGRIDGSDHIP